MQPSDQQLLKQLRKATTRILGETASSEHKALLGTMDVVINELLLRSDNVFFLDYYQRGHRLMQEGLELLGQRSGALAKAFAALPETLDGALSMDAIGAENLRLTALLTQLVDQIGDSKDDRLDSLLKRITEWELTLFSHRLQRAGADRPGEPEVAIGKENLQAYLRGRKPEWKDLEITHFQRVAGGFSKCTILFDCVDAVNGKQSLAIRAEQPIHLLNLDGSDIENEFPIVKQAFASGIPVAEPLWLEADRRHFGARFIVSRKASGSNFGTARGGDERLSAEAVKHLAKVMADIHNIPVERGADWVTGSHFKKWLAHGSKRQTTLALLAYWKQQARDHHLYPSPCIARALNWLEANVPASEEAPVFLHADFGPHNILIDGQRVSAVLDWEISMVGDPAYDVAWFLNCTGASVDRAQFLDAYRDAGGQKISEYQLRYFDVFPSMFMPTTCNAALRLLEDTDGANINLALYGLQFMHEYPSRLDAAIAKAEAVKHLR